MSLTFEQIRSARKGCYQKAIENLLLVFDNTSKGERIIKDIFQMSTVIATIFEKDKEDVMNDIQIFKRSGSFKQLDNFL